MSLRDFVTKTSLQPDATTSLSLWLDRFNPSFQQEDVRAHHARSLGVIRVPAGYARAFGRRERALRYFQGAFAVGETRLYSVELEGRAIVGIGAASVRETNLSLLRPWGIPYVPGSALKGLASHVAHRLGGPWVRPGEAGTEAGSHHRALFGDVTASGAVVFHDAWWQPLGDRAPVREDTMTVHHADYYKSDGPPADWDEPNPVSFLTSTGVYLAALTGPSEALDVAEAFLRDGLAHLGIGAKTAAGYGRAKLTRYVPQTVRSLEEFNRPPAAPNNIQHLAQEFLALASVAEAPDEVAAATRRAKALVAQSKAVWRQWLAAPQRTEEERRWFAAAAEPEPAAAPATPAEKRKAPSAGEESKTLRVWYVPDRKNPKRFLLRIDGEQREYKGHTVKIDSDLVQSLRDAGDEGMELVVHFQGKKVKGVSRP